MFRLSLSQNHVKDLINWQTIPGASQCSLSLREFTGHMKDDLVLFKYFSVSFLCRHVWFYYKSIKNRGVLNMSAFQAFLIWFLPILLFLCPALLQKFSVLVCSEMHFSGITQQLMCAVSSLLSTWPNLSPFSSSSILQSCNFALSLLE